MKMPKIHEIPFRVNIGRAARHFEIAHLPARLIFKTTSYTVPRFYLYSDSRRLHFHGFHLI
jgi:hypothetical protein